MRLRALISFASLCLLVAVASACTAELEEGCLGGNCSPPGQPPIPPVPEFECGESPATGDFPCDVFTVLDTHCTFCHTSPPVNGAPFPLLTYEDTREFAGMTTTPRWERIGAVVKSGLMPIGEPLPEADKQLILDWVNMCAPPAASMGCE